MLEFKMTDSEGSGFDSSPEGSPLKGGNKRDSKYDEPLMPSSIAAIPISTECHSLAPDMMFGWKPKILDLWSPIPLMFDKDSLPVAFNPLTMEEYPTIYNGFWPRDSL